jgi:hypothetical protein
MVPHSFSFPIASGLEQFWVYDGICRKRLEIVVSMAAKPPFHEQYVDGGTGTGDSDCMAHLINNLGGRFVFAMYIQIMYPET